MEAPLAASDLARRDVTCPTQTPLCHCEAGWSCVATARTKTTCPTVTCIKDPQPPASAGGLNPGVIVGPIVALFVVISLSLGLLALRKKRARDLRRLEELEARAQRLQMAEHGVLVLSNSSVGRSTTVAGDALLTARQPSATGDGGHSPTFAIPALPSTIKAYTASSINLDPASGRASTAAERMKRNDPFSDDRSVQTALSTDGLSFLSQSTNVIPIVFASGASVSNLSQTTGQASAGHSMRAPVVGDAQSDRLSLNSLAPSFSSINSALWDAPTIERANVVQLSQPNTPSSTSQLSSARPTAVAGLPVVPPAASSATPSIRSPLAQHTINSSALLSPVATPSPSTAARRNPFDDFPRPPTTPVTPQRQQGLASPSSPFGGSYRSVSPSPPSQQTASTGGAEDDSFSLYSLGPEQPPVRALALPQRPARPPLAHPRPPRPLSATSSIYDPASVAVQSATLVHVGREDEGPAKALFRSGSITRSRNFTPRPPPPNPPAEPVRVGPRDRFSAQTNYSAATFSSVLGGFNFILPTSPAA